MSPCRRVAVSPCRRVAVSPCRRVAVSPCRRVAVSPCRRVAVSPCRRVAVSPCRRVAVSPCRRVAVSPCRRVAVSPCRRVAVSPCRRVAVLSSLVRVDLVSDVCSYSTELWRLIAGSVTDASTTGNAEVNKCCQRRNAAPRHYLRNSWRAAHAHDFLFQGREVPTHWVARIGTSMCSLLMTTTEIK